ncbi:MAG TPA: universal stress protein [Candidatus Angelobacter sp.]
MATLAVHTVPKPVADLKNILFATDFSEASMKAFPYAATLAKKFGAQVFACHIITPTALVAAAPQAAPYLYEAERDAAEKGLEDVLRSPLLEGVNTKSVLSSGLLQDCVVDEIQNNNIDLVVAGTHGRTGWRRLLLGSAAEEICRSARCPVLTVGPELPPMPLAFKRILVPTDLSDESLRSLAIVVRLATAYGASVTVLHVLPEETAGNTDAKKLSEPIVKSMVNIFEPQLEPLKTEFIIEPGDTVETILRVAQEKKADLIAMDIRSAFLPGFNLRTSVAYRVTAGSYCPVVTCR